jgi:uncharacterized protein (TIGR03437 family)
VASAVTAPTISLGGMNLPILYAGLAPGEVGVYQMNVTVPGSTQSGLALPLTINQGSATVTVSMRVVN